MKQPLALLSFLILFSPLGCPVDACEHDADCGAGQICEFGGAEGANSCLGNLPGYRCKVDDDCLNRGRGGNGLCVSGTCASVTSCDAACTKDADCGDGGVCDTALSRCQLGLCSGGDCQGGYDIDGLPTTAAKYDCIAPRAPNASLRVCVPAGTKSVCAKVSRPARQD